MGVLETLGDWLLGMWGVIVATYGYIVSLPATEISHFSSLLEISFGVNIAYATLIRVGQLQGNRLETFWETLKKEMHDAIELLASEPNATNGDKGAPPPITSEDNDNRCANFVSEAQSRIKELSEKCAKWALYSALASLVALYAMSIWPNAKILDIISFLSIVALFAPVPLGLLKSYGKEQSCEREIMEEYEQPIAAVKLLRDKPRQEAEEAFENLRQKINPKKRPGVFKRLFRGD